MKTSNSKLFLFIIGGLLMSGLACKSLTSAGGGNTTEEKPGSAEPANAAGTRSQDESKTQKIENSELEKPDFTITAEELDREFTREGVTSNDLEKYKSKNIAVSGRVSTIVTEKKGTVQPWVTLYAPGILHGVNCYFDDDKISQLSLLTKDKMAKVQGFQGTFVVPKVSPKLEHCVVLEAN